MSFVDIKFAGLLSASLEKYEVKSSSGAYRANFRCPLCGDSAKSKSKTRGWFLESKKTDHLAYYCHNCGASMGFSNFLKIQDHNLYNMYLTEKYEKSLTRKTAKEEPKFENKTPEIAAKSEYLKTLKKISQLPHDHPAKQYVVRRKIPSNTHFRIYYAPKFKKWVNTFIPGKFETPIKMEEPRLILPFLDKEGKMFGVAARSFDPKSNLRYISIMLPGDYNKIFGMDRVNFGEPYKVVEGAIDSFFLENTVAMAGADGNSKGLEQTENATYIFDNEPRNIEIVKRISRLLNEGKSVCIWPNSIPFGDINEGIDMGYSADQITDVIEANSYRGLEGNLALTIWKRC